MRHRLTHHLAHALAAAALVLSWIAVAPAQAGVAFEQIPSRGTLPFLDNGDGTYSPETRTRTVGIDQSSPGTSNGVNLRPSVRATYRVIIDTYAAYATPTDLAGICGSATKPTVYITGFSVAAVSTAAAQQKYSFIKRSVADTGGTPSTPTPVALDSADSAATASVVSFAAAPSLGSSAGTLEIQSAISQTAGGTVASGTASLGGFSTLGGSSGTLAQPIALHGTAECVYVNYGGGALTAGFSATIHIEFTEG